MNYEQMKNILLALDNPVDRLEMMMDFGRALCPVPDDAQCFEIGGCASFVQICVRGNNFYGRADSAVVRGIVAIIIAMVDGKTPDEIRKMNLKSEFCALGINLGAGRMNGLDSMIRFLQNL